MTEKVRIHKCKFLSPSSASGTPKDMPTRFLYDKYGRAVYKVFDLDGRCPVCYKLLDGSEDDEFSEIDKSANFISKLFKILNWRKLW